MYYICISNPELVCHINVVTLSSALDLVSLERLFISLSNDVTFGRIMLLWDGQNIVCSPNGNRYVINQMQSSKLFIMSLQTHVIIQGCV